MRTSGKVFGGRQSIYGEKLNVFIVWFQHIPQSTCMMSKCCIKKLVNCVVQGRVYAKILRCNVRTQFVALFEPFSQFWHTFGVFLRLGSLPSKYLIARKKIPVWKKIWGVSCVTSKSCLIDIRRKSHVLLFLARTDPTTHLTCRHGIQKVQKWRLMVKILRENMRDMLFLDVFNQANFKYTPKKDDHMENFYWVVRSLLDFSMAAKCTNCASKVRKYGQEMRKITPKWRIDLNYDVIKNVLQSFWRIFRTFWPFLALLTRVLSIMWPLSFLPPDKKLPYRNLCVCVCCFSFFFFCRIRYTSRSQTMLPSKLWRMSPWE